ncbi:hypothetical protein A1O3_08234 [Capronia epimyces CBS 606.96]|uniref:Heterokaryon incompatibility domain-containing protein n=1 Tax=Capronia epimyces CBS 606.96 TaxID=1182542 RepID=W9XIC0_9EURO|nr:uncharacterized protein A1O3_08234 [Capronia epimyces CBS 606.96]EXJ79948.1 hypothetical protein A1O3_08234 [Capronia epimyces CBS 606.96]
MCLLKLNDDDDGALRLTEDLHDNIPAYAILSHTWGDDKDEVTLDHLDGKMKAGYTKMKFCGERAEKDNLKHFEAINSMFRWYCDAANCYVYLSDVSVSKGDEDHIRAA